MELDSHQSNVAAENSEKLMQKDSLIDQLRKENSLLQQNLTNINSQIPKIEELQLQNTNLVGDNTMLGREMRQIRNELEAEKAQISKQNEDILELKQLNRDLSKEKRQLEFEKEDLLNQLKDNADNDILEIENERLTKELSKKQKKLEILESGLVNVKGDVERIMSENEVLK